MDGLLGKRRDQDHEAITSLKTEFMQLWVRQSYQTCLPRPARTPCSNYPNHAHRNCVRGPAQLHAGNLETSRRCPRLQDGFLSEQQSNVMVLGATNRPKDLDDAVLRRFKLKFSVSTPFLRRPLHFLFKHCHVLRVESVENTASSTILQSDLGRGLLQVPLPDEKQRESILRVTLQRHSLESPVEEELLEDTPTKSANGEKPLRVWPATSPAVRNFPACLCGTVHALCVQQSSLSCVYRCWRGRRPDFPAATSSSCVHRRPWCPCTNSLRRRTGVATVEHAGATTTHLALLLGFVCDSRTSTILYVIFDDWPFSNAPRPQQNGTVDGTVADSLDRPRVSSHQGPRPMAFR